MLRNQDCGERMIVLAVGQAGATGDQSQVDWNFKIGLESNKGIMIIHIDLYGHCVIQNRTGIADGIEFGE